MGISTYSLSGSASYDPKAAWSDHNDANQYFTDSAAAGTAMATGTKVLNGALNVTPAGEELTTISELADQTGRSAGVVSSVQYSHATPASYAVANENRNNYLEIGNDMVDAEHLDVVMGAGHPLFDDNGQPREAEHTYMTEDYFNAVSTGETDWSYLETMTAGALNILGDNEEGFHLIVEPGADARLDPLVRVLSLVWLSVSVLAVGPEGLRVASGGSVDLEARTITIPHDSRIQVPGIGPIRHGPPLT